MLEMPEMADTAVAAEKGRWSQDVTPPLHVRSNSGSIGTFQCCKGVTRDPVRIRRDLFPLYLRSSHPGTARQVQDPVSASKRQSDKEL